MRPPGSSCWPWRRHPSGSRDDDDEDAFDDDEDAFFDDWLELVEQTGALAGWLDRLASHTAKRTGEAAAWFGRMLDLGSKDRWPTAAPDTLFTLVIRRCWRGRSWARVCTTARASRRCTGRAGADPSDLWIVGRGCFHRYWNSDGGVTVPACSRRDKRPLERAVGILAGTTGWGVSFYSGQLSLTRYAVKAIIPRLQWIERGSSAPHTTEAHQPPAAHETSPATGSKNSDTFAYVRTRSHTPVVDPFKPEGPGSTVRSDIFRAVRGTEPKGR